MIELPQLGESLEDPIELANGAVLRRAHMLHTIGGSVSGRLWPALWAPLWDAIVDRTDALRTAIREAL